MKNQGRREDWFSEVVVEEEEGCSERRKREEVSNYNCFLSTSC